MNQKDNQQPKGLAELYGRKKESPFDPYQRESLFPREVLQPLYDEYMAKFATSPNPSAYDFFVFLLKQVKKS